MSRDNDSPAADPQAREKLAFVQKAIMGTNIFVTLPGETKIGLVTLFPR